MMAYSQAQLDALEQAFADGALRVTFEGKTVEYGSADDLLKRINVVRAGIASQTAGKKPRVAGFASFKRG